MSELARTAKQIGTVIQRARKRRGWTQSVLAERAGLRQATVSEIESGSRAARLDTILSVLAALDLEFRIDARTRGTASDIEDMF